MAALALPSLHRLFLGHMMNSVAVVHTLQQRRSGPVDGIADLLSRLGGRSLYMYTIPAVLWLFDATSARIIMSAWAAGFYIACAMRDLLWLPRLEQVSDQVDVLKLDSHTEFGFPCVKSYSATLFPLLLSYICWQAHQASLFMSVVLSVCWVFSVLGSRVYLGVASFAAVAGGAIIAVGTAGLWILFGEAIDNVLVVTTSWVTFAQPLGCLLALMAYPVPWRYTSTFQTAAGVVGMTSGFLFGANLAVSGVLPPSLCALPMPVSLDPGLVHFVVISSTRLIVGICVTTFAKAMTERMVKQSQLTVGWFVPRLSPCYAPLLSYVYAFEELAFPLLCLWSQRPPTLRVRLDVGPEGGAPLPLSSSVGSSTSPPEAVKARKRKPGQKTEGLCATPTPAGDALPIPDIHLGSPCTWYGIRLHLAFQRMVKSGAGAACAALGPLAALAREDVVGTYGVGGDAEILPNDAHIATITATAPMFTSDARKYGRVVPAAALSHFVAGVASAILAPSFMHSLFA